MRLYTIGMSISALGLALSMALTAPEQEPPWPTEGWSTSTPAEQGLDPSPLQALHEDRFLLCIPT